MSLKNTLTLGQKVQAYYQNKWHSATILELRKDKCLVDWNNGQEALLPYSDIKTDVLNTAKEYLNNNLGKLSANQVRSYVFDNDIIACFINGGGTVTIIGSETYTHKRLNHLGQLILNESVVVNDSVVYFMIMIYRRNTADIVIESLTPNIPIMENSLQFEVNNYSCFLIDKNGLINDLEQKQKTQ